MRKLAIAVLTTVALANGVGSVRAQTVDSTLWCLEPGGRVFAIAREGNTVYIGGNFNAVGRPSGGGVPIDMASAAPSPSYPKVAGTVNTAVPDGTGGWFVGGLFAAVGGQPRANLAHITSAGQVASWAPNIDGEVHALALRGDVLYVGGAFSSVTGQPRQNIAALSTQNDAPLPWNPSADNWVMTLLPAGPVVYAGGLFKSIGGASRAYVAALDTASGQATSFDAGIDTVAAPRWRVLALAVHDTTLFVGGQFATIGGVLRRQLAAVNSMTGALRPWDAGIERKPDFILDGGPRISDLLIGDSTLYVAGSFKKIGGQDREGIAALNIASAQATTWNPRSFRNVVTGASFWSMVTSGETLFVAGAFDSLGGAPGNYTAAVDASSGARLSWDPRPNSWIWVLARSGQDVYAGGLFTSMAEWVQRRDLAAIDLRTGRATDWAPDCDNIIEDIVVRGTTVYVGGSFSVVGGQPRSGVAAIDATSGSATTWNPAVGGTVYSLTPIGATIVIGGSFGSVGGQARSNIAAIDTATGLVTAWDPGANDIVYDLAPTDSVIYVGGWFSNIAGQARATLAALDPVTGVATAWTPTTDAFVRRIALLNGTIYVGGAFNFVNGTQRDAIAAIDQEGMLTPWVANASRRILALATSDSTVYAGGGFSSIGGEPRLGIAALDAQTGAVRDWYPGSEGIVWSLTASHDMIYAGGAFQYMGNWPQAGFAAMTPADLPGPGPIPLALALSQNAPNPAKQNTLIRYSLPVAATVNLTVFDLQGRRVATLLSNVPQAAGPHEVSLRTGTVRPGFYLYRLEADGQSATRKMVVLR